MKASKWYLQIWFISLLFAFSFLIVPFIIGIVLLIKHYMERSTQMKYWQEMGLGDAESLLQTKNALQNEVEEYERKKEGLVQQVENLSKQIQRKEQELIVLDDELLMQSVGFYEPKYALETSDEYKFRLANIRNQQKQLVKIHRATYHSDEWLLDGSKSKGKLMNNNNIKLTINAFNKECDMAINKVKFTNVDAMESRIRKTYLTLNKINKHNKICISDPYLSLKIEELYLAYEYAQKVEEEKEEQRRIRDLMREEQRAQREIETAKLKIEKEERHFLNEIYSLKQRLTKEASRENSALLKKIEELEAKLALIRIDKKNVFHREQNTRAGYVYIISNLGSFGEDVYKIGMTRRLDPNDRVKELGDASVPFRFDTHALIFSEDAPSLENALHKAFHHRRVNKINNRKEFFHVTLQEIEDEVRRNHNEVVQFTKIAEAKEFRESVSDEQVSA